MPLLEELVDLAFEWTHKTLDLLFTEVFGLVDDAAQKASAWSLFFLVAGLLGWGGYTLRRQYLRMKAAAPHWRAERQADLKAWWAGLPWTMKLAHVAGCLVLVAVLAMFI